MNQSRFCSEKSSGNGALRVSGVTTSAQFRSLREQSREGFFVNATGDTLAIKERNKVVRSDPSGKSVVNAGKPGVAYQFSGGWRNVKTQQTAAVEQAIGQVAPHEGSNPSPPANSPLMTNGITVGGCMPLYRIKNKAVPTSPASNARLMPEAESPVAIHK